MAKRFKKILAGAVFLTGSLALFTPQCRAEPVALDDVVLDYVTAGTAAENASGGVVVGGNSGAEFDRTNGLDLSGGAQEEARGLNIVNSVESAVANGVNVWDGGAVSAHIGNNDADPALAVNQSNIIGQEQRRAASISGYSRPEADTSVEISRSGTTSGSAGTVRRNSVNDLFEETAASNKNSYAEVDTSIKLRAGDDLSLEANIGQGVAVAGELNATFDGGEAEFALAAGAGISADFELGIKDFAGVKVGASADADLSLFARIELPKMEIEFNGAGCGVVLGSCKASGETVETTVTVTDKSTLDILDETEAGESSFTETRTEVYRSPFELDGARAEYIVIDGSSLKLDSTVTLRLSGSAQRGVRGMNVVNAVGSSVANGVNISRTGRLDGSGPALVLNQTNIIHHSR